MVINSGSLCRILTIVRLQLGKCMGIDLRRANIVFVAAASVNVAILRVDEELVI
jgi:hypothetical protein